MRPACLTGPRLLGLLVAGAAPTLAAQAPDPAPSASVANECAAATAMAKKPVHLTRDGQLALACAMDGKDDAAKEAVLLAERKRLEQHKPRRFLVPRAEVKEAVAAHPDLGPLLERAPDTNRLDLEVAKAAQSWFPSTRKQEQKLLGAGPLLRLKPDAKATEGHYGVTGQALRAVATIPAGARVPRVPSGVFAVRLHEIIKDAAQDPDFYEWGTAAAHAQTPCREDKDARPLNLCDDKDQTPAAAVRCGRERFLSWIDGRLAETRKACEAGDGSQALYRVGYMLHAIQDLAAHRGRTNAEHSWNEFKDGDDGNPDHDPDNVALAQQMTERFLVEVGKGLGRACAGAIRTVPQDVGWLPKAWKNEHLGSWDVGPWQFVRYWALADKFQGHIEAKNATRVRWFEVIDRVDTTAKLRRCEDEPRCDGILKEVLSLVASRLPPP